MQKTLLIAVAALSLAACSSDKAAKKATTTPVATAAPQKKAAAAPEPAKAPASTIAVLGSPDAPIYFDFDSEQLRPESADLLKQVAAYLKQNPNAHITISGHADDTGTSEYNMALGDKRAATARKYLETLGVEGKRIQTISFGEEKPAVDGVSDDARQKNRRDEFDVVQKDAQSASR